MTQSKKIIPDPARRKSNETIKNHKKNERKKKEKMTVPIWVEIERAPPIEDWSL